MSSKRRSDLQITKDGASLSRDDDDNDRDVPQKANEKTLARRKMIQLKKRAPAGVSPSFAVPVPSVTLPVSSNPFSGLGNGTSSAFEQAPAAQNPFGFLSKPAVTTHTASNSHSIDDYKLKQRALNEKFAEEIAKLKDQSIYSDWTKTLESYIQYGKEIASGTSSSTPTINNTVTPSFGFGSGSGFGSITSTGTGASAVSKNINLSKGFGGFATNNSASSAIPASSSTSGNSGNLFSASSAPVAAPAFAGSAFSNTPEFTIPAIEQEPKIEVKQPEPVAIDESDSDSGDDEIKIQGPKFILDKPLSTSGNSPFSFSNKDESKSEPVDSGFRFQPSEKTVKSVFKFQAPPLNIAKDDKKAPEAPHDAPKPFSFGTPTESEKKEIATKPFSFGAPVANEKKASAPTPFSFEAPANDKKENAPTPFSFGALASTGKKEDAVKSFTFNSSPATTDTTEAPPKAFVVEASAPSENKQSAEKPFSFGGSSSSAFSFTSPAEKKESVSGFGFGGTTSSISTAATPAFTFGSTKSGTSSTDHTWSPDKGIKFGGFTSSSDTQADGEKPLFGLSGGFSFGSGATANPFGSSAAAPVASTPSQDNAGAEGEDGEPALPQVDLSQQGAGEEDEECIYEKKAKAYELVGKEYKVLGIGPLRLLKHKDSNKTRILLRAEGSGRVILNTLLKSQVTYKTEGKGQVRVLDFKADGTPTTYLVRVKTENDANELKDKLEEYKN